jgi:hypothetical protein
MVLDLELMAREEFQISKCKPRLQGINLAVRGSYPRKIDLEKMAKEVVHHLALVLTVRAL